MIWLGFQFRPVRLHSFPFWVTRSLPIFSAGGQVSSTAKVISHYPSPGWQFFPANGLLVLLPPTPLLCCCQSDLQKQKSIKPLCTMTWTPHCSRSVQVSSPAYLSLCPRHFRPTPPLNSSPTKSPQLSKLALGKLLNYPRPHNSSFVKETFLRRPWQAADKRVLQQSLVTAPAVYTFCKNDSVTVTEVGMGFPFFI